MEKGNERRIKKKEGGKKEEGEGVKKGRVRGNIMK